MVLQSSPIAYAEPLLQPADEDAIVLVTDEAAPEEVVADEGTAEEEAVAEDAAEEVVPEEATTDEEVIPEETDEADVAEPEEAEAEPEEAEAEKTEEEAEATKSVYVYEDDAVKVTATLTEAAAIPDDAEFRVTRITPESDGYNYDAYMAAANEALATGEEEPRYTEENSLLYDVAFLVNKTDEEGNPIEGELVEVQPAQGSVTLNFEFKQGQLAEIGAESAENVNLIHLPLADEVREQTDTTEAATDITADDIIVEQVDSVATLEDAPQGETVEYSLDNFSATLITADNGINYYTAEDTIDRVNYEVLLGNAMEYGIVADTYNQVVHTQTNFAVKNYDPEGGSQVVEADLCGEGAVPFIVGNIGNNGHLRFGGSVSEATATRYDVTINERYRNNPNAITVDNQQYLSVNPNYQSQANINATIDSMLAWTQGASSALKDRNVTVEVTDAAIRDVNHFTLDITRYASNAVIYINVPAGSNLADVINHHDGLSLVKYADQVVVFNMQGSDVNLKKIDVILHDQDNRVINSETSPAKDSEHNNDVDNYIVRKIVWNLPNATKVDIDTCAGLFLVPTPGAMVEFRCGAGWLATAGTARGGSGEWHFTFKGRKYNANSRLRFTGLKEFVDTNGKVLPMGDHTFTFDLYEADRNYNTGGKIESVTANKNNSKVEFEYLNITEQDFDYNAGSSSQYYDPSTDSWKRTFYYVIKEQGGGQFIDGITYWPGELDIQLTAILHNVTSASGNLSITFDITSMKYNEANKGGTPERNNNVRVIGDEFNFGQFRNVLNSKDYITFSGKKVIQNRSKKLQDQEFSFTITEVDANHRPTGYTETVKNDGNGNITFKAIEFNAGMIGTHYYEVKETSTDGNGVKVDKTVYTATVVVTQDAQGNVHAEETSRIYNALNFTNTYEAKTQAQIQVNKRLVGQPLKAGMFSYRLTPVDKTTAPRLDDYDILELWEEFPIYDPETGWIIGWDIREETTWGKVKTNAVDGAVDFGNITFTGSNAGKSYVYKIEELGWSPMLPGYYGIVNDSPMVMYAKVTVGADKGDGTMEDCTVKYYWDKECTEEVPSAEFVNKYTASGSIVFKAQKYLSTGETPAEGAYEFQLFDGQGNLLDTKTTDADGIATFDTFYFDVNDLDAKGEGTYTFTIHESSNPGDGWTNAPDQEVTVDVADTNRSSGVISVVKLSENVVKTEGSESRMNAYVDFTNTYDANGTAKFAGVKKVLNGRDITDEDYFSFFIMEGQTVVATGSADTEGNVSFSQTVSYTYAQLDKTDATTGKKYADFTYVVNEHVGDEAAIRYNPAGKVDEITVRVTDNGDGTLSVAQVTDEGVKPFETDDSGAYVIDFGGTEFTNEYEAKGTLELSGKKTITNKPEDMDLSGFKFTVKEGDTTVATGESDPDGNITFTPISYVKNGATDQTGTHTYVVTEDADSKPGVTNTTTSVTVKVNVTDNGDGTLKVEKTGDSVAINAVNFTNTYGSKGETEIKITKALSDGAVWPEGKTATFSITANNGGPLPAQTTVTLSSAGEGTFGTVALSLADAGKTYTYTIKETSDWGDGWTKSADVTATVVVSADDGKGNLTATVSYTDNDTITNTYDANGTAKFAGVVKVLKGRDITDEDVFGFYIMEGQTVVATGTADTEGNVSFSQTVSYTYAQLTKTDETTGAKYADFTYVVNEHVGDDAAIKYNPEGKVDEITVRVTDNGDGTLSVAEVTDEGVEPFETDDNGAYIIDFGNTEFTNEYEAKGTLDLSGKKTIENKPDSMDLSGFKFTVKEGDEVVATGTSAADGTITFTTINYVLNGTTDDTGEHTYVVSEDADSKPGVTNTTATKTVKVTVTDNGNGTLDVKASSDSPAAINAVNFTNTYGASGDLTLSGKKTIANKPETMDLSGFKFTVKEGDATVATGTSAADGTITFSTISYTEPGEHTYVVSEDADSKPGVTNTTATQTVKVTVTDKGDGTLDVKASTDSPAAINAVDFENTYSAKGSFSFSGVTKKLVGRAITGNDNFGFTIVDGDGKTVAIGLADTTGKVTFAPDTINFTLADVGEHTYTVKEAAGTIAGVTYDTSSETMTVTVADNGDGTLAVTSDKTDFSFGKEFVNTYKAEGSVNLVGGKVIANKPADMDLSGFKFQITDDATGEVVAEATSTADGVISFPAIKYVYDEANGIDETGTHTYTVSETADSKPGVKNDTSTKPVQVVVTDNGDGTLSAVATVDGQPASISTLLFNNEYETKGTVKLEVKKALLGTQTWPEGKTATFTLSAITEGAPMPDAAGQKATATSATTAQFGEITFKLEDAGKSYIYRITEDETFGSGWTKSADVVATVVVGADNGDGTLKPATVSYTNNDTITNTYSAWGELNLEGSKTIVDEDGHPLAMDLSGYYFIVRDVTDGGRRVAATGTSSSNGSVSFGSIIYTLNNLDGQTSKTFSYSVEEYCPSPSGTFNGMTYDIEPRTFEVTVTDNGDGTMSVSNPPAAADLVFKNVFNASSDVQIAAGKRLVGRNLQEEEFQFGLYAEGASEPMQTKKNDELGAVVFDPIKYEIADLEGETSKVFKYTVKEIVPADSDKLPGVTYNPEGTELEYEVTVTFDGVDKLTAEITKSPSSAFITNTYDASGELHLSGKKTVVDASGNPVTLDLTGIKFNVVDEENNPVTTGVSDEDGDITFKAIPYTLGMLNQVDESGNAFDTFTYYVYEESAGQTIDGITYTSTIVTVNVKVTDAGNGTLRIEKTQDSDIAFNAVDFQNSYEATGSFSFSGVTKKLVGRAITGNDNFGFTIVDDAGKTVAIGLADTTGKVTFAPDTINYTLADVGEHKYTVTEFTGTIAGVTYDTSSETMTVTVADNHDGTLAVTSDKTDFSFSKEFTNTYKAEGSVNLVGGKVINNRPASMDLSGFKFQITDDATGEVVAEATSTADGVISFPAIKYVYDVDNGIDDTGTHTYTVSEAEDSKPGVTNDTTTKPVQVVVTDNGDGTLSAVATVDGQPASISTLLFTNEYSADGTLNLSGKKTIANKPEDMNLSGFKFTVKEGDTTVATGTSDADGNITFSAITYTLDDVGEHTYVVSEDADSKPGVTNSTTTLTVKVTVTDDGEGGLEVKASTDSPVAIDAVNFDNTYSAKGSFTLTGNKSIKNKPEGMDLSGYTFEVKEGDKVVATGTSAADGKITFSTINYTLADAGDHEYKVTETGGSKPGVTNTTTTANVKVTVTDNGDGTLSVTGPSGAATIDPANFENVYDANGKLTLEGRKTITNRPASMDLSGFKFTVKEGNKTVATGESAIDGKITFTEITYGLADAGKTFTYTVTEDEDSKPGVTNTTTPVTVKVDVIDNGDGTLSVKASEGSVAINAVNFTNDYAASGDVTLEITKAIAGTDTWPEGKSVEFTLTAQTAGAPMPEAAGQKATATAVGKAQFGKISYQLSDAGKTYRYKISETTEFGAGWTKSADVIATVVVGADNGDGTLAKSTVTYSNSGTITNTYAAKGDFTLLGKKSITPVPKDVDLSGFTFTVKEGDNVVATGVSNEDGSIDFTTITYTQADAGKHTYVVSEDGAGTTINGITYTSTQVIVNVNVTDNGDGTLDAKGAEGEIEIYAEFDNTYAATGELTLEGTKSITNRPSSMDLRGFKFTATEGDKDVTTATSTATGAIKFGTITYTLDDVGEHTYEITEDKTQVKPGVTNDTATHTLTVTVSDNGDGTLNVEKTGGDVEIKAVNFTNTYAASGEATLEITKALAGVKNWPKDKSVTFTVTPGEGSPAPENLTVTATAAGTVSFGKIELELADAGKTYTYTISETADFGEGWTKSADIVATLKVGADNGDGTLAESTVTYNNAATITNTYKATGELELSGTKTIANQPEALTDLSGFLFNVVDQATGDTVATGSSDSSGKITFSKIAYGLSDLTEVDEETGLTYGEFTYVVSEDENATKPGVTNTTETKTVTVKVSDDGKGNLVAATADTSVVKINEVDFENTYSSDGEFSFGGVIKVLLGRELAAGEFTFVIKDADGTVVATGSNKTDGGVDFDSTIKLSSEDVGETYTYTVSEVIPDSPNPAMDYDPTDKPIDVTITDDGQGHLLANGGINPVIYFTKTFTNIYTADGSVQLIAHKHISGRDLTAEDAGKFSFELLDAEGNVLQTKTNDANGVVAFDSITYTKNDLEGEDTKDFAYTIREVIPAEADRVAGMTYDEHEEDVTVTVFRGINDKGEYVLIAQPTYSTEEGAIFTNEYVAEGEVTFSGTKTIAKAPEGVDLSGFTFSVMEGETEVATGVSDADGNITYTPIEYVLNGTTDPLGEHIYTVSETGGSKPGVTNSLAKVEVRVNVTDNGDGTLTAVASDSSPVAIDAVSFENTYDSSGSFEIEGIMKKLNNGTLETGQFTFQVVNQNGRVVARGTNMADGTVVFESLAYSRNSLLRTDGTYSDSRTYNYTVSEVIPAGATKNADGSYKLGDITYSTDEVKFTVTISDDGKGNIVADSAKDGIITVEHTFVNKNEPPTPPVPKTDDVTNFDAIYALAVAGMVSLALGVTQRRRSRRED